MKKIKGEAVIKLKNAKTGKVEYQKKTNIITKIPALATSYIPFGFGNYAPSIIDLMGGMLLFSNSNTIDENNFKLTQLPLGWSGIDINSISNCGKGYLVPSECSFDGDSITITHEWGTSQANGTISSISLTNPAGCMKSAYLLDSCFWTYGHTKYVNRINASTGFKNQLGTEEDKIGHLLHFDIDNNLFYDCYLESDYQTLHVRKIKRSASKLLLDEQTHGEYYTIKGGISGVFSTDLSSVVNEYTVRLLNELTWGGATPRQLINSYYFDSTNDILYIFSTYLNDNQKLQITKISGILSGSLSETYNTLDLSNIFSANSVLGSGLVTDTRYASNWNINQIIVKDAIAFRNNYVYLQTTGSKMLKLNIADLSDYSILDLPSTYHYCDSGSFINDGNMFYGKVTLLSGSGTRTVVIDMVNDIIQMTANNNTNYNYSSTYTGYNDGYFNNSANSFTEFCKINDAWFLEYNSLMTTETYGSAYCSLVLNPAYMATINNVTPILKTSAQTLTITYTLREVEESEG